MSANSKTGVILIHGLTGHPSEMRVPGRYLEEKGYVVDVPMLPGHGAGHNELLASRAKDWLAGTRAMVDAMSAKCDEIFLVGLCASSVLAALVAADDPRIDGMVLLSSHYGKIHPSNGIQPYFLPFLYKLPRFLRQKLYWVEQAPYGLKDPRLQQLITDAIEQSKKSREAKDFGTFRTYLDTFYEIDLLVKELKVKAKNVKCPALLIHSLEDTWFSTENSINLCNDLSSEEKSVLLINNCNHVLSVDLRKNDVAREIETFVRRHSKVSQAARAAEDQLMQQAV